MFNVIQILVCSQSLRLNNEIKRHFQNSYFTYKSQIKPNSMSNKQIFVSLIYAFF